VIAYELWILTKYKNINYKDSLEQEEIFVKLLVPSNVPHNYIKKKHRHIWKYVTSSKWHLQNILLKTLDVLKTKVKQFKIGMIPFY